MGKMGWQEKVMEKKRACASLFRWDRCYGSTTFSFGKRKLDLALYLEIFSLR